MSRKQHDTLTRTRLATAVVVVIALAMMVGMAGASVAVTDDNGVFVGEGTVFDAGPEGPTVEISEDMTLDSPFDYPDEHTVDLSPKATFHSVGDTDVTVLGIDGTMTALETHDVSHTLTVDPHDKQAVQIRGDAVNWVEFADVDLTDDTPVDLAYDAADLDEVTVLDTGLPEGETVEAHDIEGGELDSSSVDADGAVTFTDLPSGEWFVTLVAPAADMPEPDSITALATQDVVGVGDEIHFVVTVEDEAGNPVPDTIVKVSDDDNLDELIAGEQDTTNTAGEAFFTATSAEPGEYTATFTEADAGTAAATVTVLDDDDSGDAIPIADWHDLHDVRNDLSADYVLVDDLDEESPGYDDIASSDANDGDGFEPIGDIDDPFTGTFDGNDHTIADIVIDRGDEFDVGLFGVIENGAVHDISINDATVVGNEYVGAIAGSNIGGVVSDSAVDGSVTGSTYVGGAIGNQEGGDANRLIVNAYVEGTTYATGGIVGQHEGTVAESWFAGFVQGADTAGGIVGWHGDGTIERSFVDGVVNGSDAIGGIAGENRDSIGQTYVAADLAAESNLGAIVGDNHQDGTITDAYWDTETTGVVDAIGAGAENVEGEVAGLTHDEMTGTDAVKSMSALDFEATWTPTESYPTLQWIAVDDDPDPADEIAIADTTLASDDLTDAQLDEIEVNVNAVAAGQLAVQLWNANPAPDEEVQELANVDGVNADTVFEITVILDEEEAFIPHLLVGTGDDLTWDVTENGATELTIEASPESASYALEETPTFADWEEETADIDFEHMVDTTLVDMEELGGPDEAADLDGMWITTDAQIFTIPTYVPGDEQEDGQLTLEIAAPTEQADGTDNDDGFFEAFLPDALLDSWGVENPEAELLVSVGETDEFDVTVGDDGAIVSLSIAYSVNEVEIAADLAELDGSGTIEDPYVITDVEALQAMANDLDAHYVLDGDIDATATATWNDGDGFEPIGDVDDAFAGTFDGQGYTISGLTIDRGATDRVGLFGDAAHDAVIENVALEAVTIDGDHFVGALVGENRGEVRNVHVAGTVDGNQRVGGVVGYNLGGSVDDARATTTVTGAGNTIGGLVGWNEGTVTRSSASGDVTGASDVGGLIGGNEADEFGRDGNVTESFATGDVTGESRVGGLIGESMRWVEDGGQITASYATGNVTGDNRVGGLIGESNSVLLETYATGDVVADDDVAGLVGVNVEYDDREGVVSASYWDVDATGHADGVDTNEGTFEAIGLSTADMIGDAATTGMGDFDFDQTWEPVTADHEHADVDYYPILQALDDESQLDEASVEPGEPDAVFVADATVVAGTTGELTVEIVDEEGNPVPDATVEVLDDDGLGGIDVGTQSQTDETGLATFTFEEVTSGEYAVEVSTDDPAINDIATVTVEAGDADGVTAEPAPADETATADGTDEVIYTIEVLDEHGNPIAGVDVEGIVVDGVDVLLTAADGGQTGTTDETGMTTFAVTSANAQDAAIEFVEQQNGNFAIGEPTFEAGDPADIFYQAEPADETVRADGTEPILYTVTVVDAFDNPVESVLVGADATDGTDVILNDVDETVAESTGPGGTVEFAATAAVVQEDVEITFGVAAADHSVSATATFEPVGAYYAVDIVETNSPVTEGEELVVTAIVENVGVEAGEQDVALVAVDDPDDPIDRKEAVALDDGESIELSFTTDETDGVPGTHELSVQSENDADVVEVTIKELTIQSLIDAAEPGDTVDVPSGTYDEDVLVQTDGVTIRAATDERPTLHGGFEIQADDVTIEGFAIVGGLSAGPGQGAGIFSSTGPDDMVSVTVTDTTITEPVTGLWIDTAQTVELHDVTVNQPTESGIILPTVHAAQISATNVEDAGESGIVVTGTDSDSGSVAIEAVTVKSTGEKGIDVSDVGVATLTDVSVIAVPNEAGITVTAVGTFESEQLFIENVGAMIYLESVESADIIDVVGQHADAAGIWGMDLGTVEITDATITDTGASAIAFPDVVSVDITAGTIEGTENYGITISGQGMDTGSVSVTDTSVEHTTGSAIDIGTVATLELTSLDISHADEAIVLDEIDDIVVIGIDITLVGVGIDVADSETLLLTDSVIHHVGAEAVLVEGLEDVSVTTVTIVDVHYGIRAVDTGAIAVVNSELREVTVVAIEVSERGDVSVSGTVLSENHIAVIVDGVENAAINGNVIAGNDVGVDNHDDTISVDATNNWWGHSNGPSGDGPGDGDWIEGDVVAEPVLGITGADVVDVSEFAGVVYDQQGLDIELTGIQVEQFDIADGHTTIELAGEKFDVPIEDGKLSVTIDPAEVFGPDTDTGEYTLAIDDIAVDVQFVHEVYGLDEGYTRWSIPQPAALYTTDGVLDMTQWSTTDASYDDINFAVNDHSLVSAGNDLHTGFYVHAATSEERFGFDYVEAGETELSPGGAPTIKPGWNFLGSNYDISTGIETLNLDLNTVSNLPPEASDYSGDEGMVAHHPSTFARLGGDRLIEPYDTYWVYVDADEDAETRAIGSPEYDPTERADRLDPYEVTIDTDNSDLAVDENEDVTVVAMVENTGDLPGTLHVTVGYEETGGEVDKTIELEAGESVTVDLSFAADPSQDGESVFVHVEDDDMDAEAFDLATVTIDTAE